MYWPNLKSVALPIPEIIWSTYKLWADPGYAHTPFSPKFYLPAKLKPVDLPVPEIIAIEVLGGAANPNLGEEEAIGVRDGTVRNRVGEFL